MRRFRRIRRRVRHLAVVRREGIVRGLLGEETVTVRIRVVRIQGDRRYSLCARILGAAGTIVRNRDVPILAGETTALSLPDRGDHRSVRRTGLALADRHNGDVHRRVVRPTAGGRMIAHGCIATTRGA
jgi:hypothetical protein